MVSRGIYAKNLTTKGQRHEENFAVLSVRTLARREDFGLRWQSAAATPLFDCGQNFQSAVALRFPPQSKKI
jgi:hypothetical protein